MSSDKKTKTRDQIDSKYKWNIEAMYSDEAKWTEDLDTAKKMADEFVNFAGRLAESANVLLSAFQKKDEMWMKVERAFVYARMKKDEDNRAEKYQSMSEKAHSIISGIAAKTSFFTPELLAMPEEKLLGFLNESEGLGLYRHVIMDTLREKEHVLSEAEERIMAQYSEITSATNNIFSMINNADIKFGEIKDEDGDTVEVTHGKYIGFMQSKDRNVRKEAFEHMYSAYEKQRNTLATTYNYNTKTDMVTSRIRKYGSAIESALSGDNIPLSVYDNLIDVVNDRLPAVHRYMEIRRRALGLDQLHMYDMYVPIVDIPKEELSYEKALDIARAGLEPLGPQYISDMNKGFEAGWVDVYENEGKTSGAYSFGSYDSMPYVLLNFDGKLQDVFTIVHEMGHSMHSYYTRKEQPYVYGGHSIFTAEVASTVNESLLMKHLLGKEQDPEKKKYLLNLYIEEFRTTLFRQTMFAEFEKMTHARVEEGEVLTADWLSEEYGKLNEKYYGDQVFYDPQIKMEWSRIPHFYNAFYVYKYATGFSAAAALSAKILKEGEPAREAYLEFLKSGEKDHPIELLKLAGVDMSTKKPIEMAMDTFESLVDQLEEMM